MSISGVPEGNSNLPHDFTTLQKPHFSFGENYAEKFMEAFKGNPKVITEQKPLPKPNELQLVSLQHDANKIQLELLRLEQRNNGAKTPEMDVLTEKLAEARREIARLKNAGNL